jgi:hypothetical protein
VNVTNASEIEQLTRMLLTTGSVTRPPWTNIFGHQLETTERVVPKLRNPLAGRLEPVGLQDAEVFSPALLAANQPGGFEHAKVLRDGRSTDGVMLGELPHGHFTATKLPENVTPHRIAEGIQDTFSPDFLGRTPHL